MSKKTQGQPANKFPLYRRGTTVEVTSKDLTDHIAKVLSDIYTLRYGHKITIRFGNSEEDTKKQL